MHIVTKWSLYPCCHTSLAQIITKAVREAAIICPHPCKLTFDLESGIRVTYDVGYPCANFSLPRPLCSRLRPDVRDWQMSDVHHRLMPPTLWAVHNNQLWYSGTVIFTNMWTDRHLYQHWCKEFLCRWIEMGWILHEIMRMETNLCSSLAATVDATVTLAVDSWGRHYEM